MPVLTSPEKGARLAAALDELLPREPHLAYANFAPIAGRPGAAEALHRERWAAQDAEVWVARSPGDAALAALRVQARPFESAHFGLTMAKLEAPLAVAAETQRREALAALYAAVIPELTRRGVDHVAARCSTEDLVAPWQIQVCGGRHVDTQVSWMAVLGGGIADRGLPAGLRCETHEGEAIGRALDPPSWKRLSEWSARSFDRGPLVFDPRLPAERSRAVYAAWTERVMTGEWADAVLLVRDGDEIVAFISMLEMPDVSRAAGARVCGRGLGATLPEYRGLFTAIQREMLARPPLAAAFMENETQAATVGSVNVYAKLGFRYLRSTSTFHWDLREPRR